MTECVALVVAAGRGARFGSETPKQYRRIGGTAILRRAIQPFLGHPKVTAVRAVVHPDDCGLYTHVVAGLDLLEPSVGGPTRQESARLGLESLKDIAPNTVLIHDAARPFVDLGLISRVIEALKTSPGALPVLPVLDTLKRGPRTLDGFVASTVDRGDLWRAQTPQGFHYNEILAAHRRFAGAALTDDSAVAERAGLAVRLVEGDENNIKMTTSDDFRRAERWLSTPVETRTGLGFDVHRFCAGGRIMLCGVPIPHSFSLEGHSDADVGLHALTDALLGAIGAGDIGTHFPPSNPQWRGASSEVFLRHAGTLVTKAGGRIINLDITVVCEEPRIAPYRKAMCARISDILAVSPERVGVKGKTTERLGFTGRQEGIAAQAIATVELPSKA